MTYRMAGRLFVVGPILMVAGLFACAPGGERERNPSANSNAQTTDSAPLRIVSSSVDVSPVDYLQDIWLRFNKKISVNNSDVLLYLDPAGNKSLIPVSIDFNDSTLTLTLAATLQPDRTYSLQLKNTITDGSEKVFAGKVYTFATTKVGGTGNDPATGNTGNPGTAVKYITLIELNDLHANLVPHWDQVRTVNGATVKLAKRGGLARIAVKIQEIRASNSLNSILMNIGDTYHGGAEATFSVGSDIVAPVDALGIDVAVPGNWDFAHGPIVSNARFAINGQTTTGVARPGIKYLGANTQYKNPTDDPLPVFPGPLGLRESSRVFEILGNNLTSSAGAVVGDPFMYPTHVIKTNNNVTVGFIGLTSDIVKRMHPMMALNIKFTQGRDAYIALIKKHASELRMRSKVDYIVVMSELGIQKDLELAKALNSNIVNIFFSAHTHELTQEPRVTDSGVYVVESGNDTYLGQMDIKFNAANQVLGHAWQIHQIDNKIVVPANHPVALLVAQAQDKYIKLETAISIPQIVPEQISLPSGFSLPNFITPQTLNNKLNDSLGTTSVPLHRINSLQSPFNNAYTDLLRTYANTDLAITPGFRFDATAIPPSAIDVGFISNARTSYNWQIEPSGTINSNDIRTADVYRFIPVQYFIARGEITAANLKTLLEANLNEVYSDRAFEQNGGWMMGISGMTLQVDLKKPKGQRVVSMKVGATVVDSKDSTQRFSVAGCVRPLELPGATRLCSFPFFENVVADTISGNDFLIQQLQAGNLNRLTQRNNITDNARTKMWPDTDFVQPIEGAAAAPL